MLLGAGLQQPQNLADAVAALLAQEGFMRALARETGRHGITANAICPIARTRMTTDATPSTAALMAGENVPERVVRVTFARLIDLVIHNLLGA